MKQLKETNAFVSTPSAGNSSCNTKSSIYSGDIETLSLNSGEMHHRADTVSIHESVAFKQNPIGQPRKYRGKTRYPFFTMNEEIRKNLYPSTIDSSIF